MIKRLLRTTIVLLPSVTLYVSKRIGLHELFILIVAILVYYILYNSKHFHYYQSTVIKLHPKFPDTRILSVTDLVEYLCIRTQVIPAAIIMVITVYKMTVLLFDHLIRTGKPITLEVQVLSKGAALFYVIASILTWIFVVMLYPIFTVVSEQLYKYLYEKYNVLIED